MPKITPQNLPDVLRLNATTYPHMAEVLATAADFIDEAYNPVELGYRVFVYENEWVAVPVGDERLKYISGVADTPVGALHECIIGVIGALEIIDEDKQ